MTVVINPSVHADSNLSRRDFLARLSNVEGVRTNRHVSEEGLTVYIHSVESFNYYTHLQAAIRNGDFAGLDGRYRVRHFGIDISESVQKWFERTELAVIQRQVVCWLTALYAQRPSSREIMEQQIYPPFMTEILRLYADFFAGRADYNDEEVDISPIYHAACKYYYNSVAPEILSIPGTLHCSEGLAREWNVKGDFDITIGRFYFRESDWRRIVLEKVEDNLLRVESSTEYFDQWKHMFASYDSHQRHIFGLFDSELSGGYVYLIEASDTGNFKIGFTKNPDIEQRRSQLQTGNSEELVVRGSFRCASPQTEKVLHAIFRESRRQGEWFALSVAQARNILDEQWRRENLIF